MFSPVEPPRVSVAADGTVAAIHEASRVTLLELPGAAAFAEIGVDPDALASEVTWVGAPPRLLVLSRYAAHTTVHLIDPYGPRTIAEIRLESPMRLFATVGASALVVGSVGAAVLSAGESHLLPYQFPARVVPVTAGAAASQFVVALAGSIEEWDPQTRSPKRRLRLPRAAVITAVGGSERVVWMTTQQEPARIDVIALVNRGQPKVHDLPEPIARIAGHPRSDLVACIGAETGKLYVVDLDGRTRLRVIEPSMVDRFESVGLVIGRTIGVLVAQAGYPVAMVSLDGRDLAGSAAAPLHDEPASQSTPPDAPDGRDDDRERGERTELDDDGPDPAAATAASLFGEADPDAASASSLFGEADPAASVPSLLGEADPDAASASSLFDGPVPGTQRSSSASPPSPAPARSLAALGRSPAASTASSSSSASTASSAAPTASWAAPTPSAAPAPPATSRGSPSTRPARPSASSAPAVAQPFATVRMAPPAAPMSSLFRTPVAPPGAPRSPAPAAAGPAPSGSERFSAWRDLMRPDQPHVAPAAPAARPAAPPAHSDAALPWRDQVVAWSQAVSAGAIDHGAPAVPAIDTLLARFDLALELQPVLALLYGAHLCGQLGAAPVDVARVLDRQWDEALGRGELARRGVARYDQSRVALSPVILRMLDELPPATGTLVGDPGPVALLGPCVVVAGDEPLTAVAERCLASVGGAILAARDDSDRAALFFEARAYGGAPMLRIAASLETASTDPAIFVVADAELADRLGVPRLA